MRRRKISERTGTRGGEDSVVARDCYFEKRNKGNVFNNKTKEMKRLCYLYKHDKNVKIDHRADAYVFLLDKNTDASVKGYMPRTNSEGFVFIGGADMDKDRISETLIHELCHGLYGLEHTFEYGVDEKSPSDNIMSYSESLNRYPSKYFQWHLIENPKDYHLPFTDSAEDGEWSLKTLKEFLTSKFHWIGRDSYRYVDLKDRIIDFPEEDKIENGEAFYQTVAEKTGNLPDQEWNVDFMYSDWKTRRCDEIKSLLEKMA